MTTSETPIEDYLDELLRRTRADARTTRRLLDEAGDHLHTSAAELEASGMSRLDAEAEAVRRYGPVPPIVRATARRTFIALVTETARAAIFLAGCGLVAVGMSGLVALVMNASLGPAFVGATGSAPSTYWIHETAHDAVALRILAGVAGLLVLLLYLAARRRWTASPVLPVGLVDALGAAAFAAGTVGLGIYALDRAAQNGSNGVGFTLSGAIVALPATVYFCVRATRALLAAPRPAPMASPT